MANSSAKMNKYFNKASKLLAGASVKMDSMASWVAKQASSTKESIAKSWQAKVPGKIAAGYNAIPGSIGRVISNRFGKKDTGWKGALRGIGNVIQRPSRLVTRSPKKALDAAKAMRRAYKKIPKPIRMGGLVGGIALGATAMLGVSILKGANDQGKQIAYTRYMQDQSRSREVLSSTRLGAASGTNKMLNYGGTIGLANALSGTRHGR